MKRFKFVIKPLLISLVIYLVAFIFLIFRIFYPMHRIIALIFLAISGVPLIISLRKNRALFEKKAQKAAGKIKKYLPYIASLILLGLFIYTALVLAPVEKSPLQKMAVPVIEEHVSKDMARLEIMSSNMNLFLDYFRQDPGIAGNFESLTPAEKNRIRNLWIKLLLQYYEISLVRQKYKGFLHIDVLKYPELHARAFVLSYISFILQLKTGSVINESVHNDYFLKKFLNDSIKSAGIKKKTYSRITQLVTNPDNLLRLNAGTAYWNVIQGSVEQPAVKTMVNREIAAIHKRLNQSSRIFIENPLDILEEETYRNWYPVQKNIAKQISFIRTTERDYFISRELLQQVRPRLEPGDILLERRKWHMTNVGIPGFWPHAALYIGTVEDINVYFSELETLYGTSPALVIKERFPLIFEKMSGKDEQGIHYSVIEAIRPGVVFTSFEQSGHADYLAVLRPKVSKKAKFEALLYALAQYGKPYDYDFDFATDSALVCSELVYKAYHNKEDFTFSTSSVNGRILMAPTMIAKKFIDEHAAGKKQLEFVLFIDSNEKNETAFLEKKEIFLKTVERPGWDIFLE